MPEVTVAIPVLDGGELFARALDALEAQTVKHELLVCDSGSTDGSLELAREHGARVIEIAPGEFNHGRTRNLLMGSAHGQWVALLTQDAEPGDTRWLERLLSGFRLAPDVGIVYGSYRPRQNASLAMRIELEAWFSSLAPDGVPQVERLDEAERSLPPLALMGRRGFFTDANACIARSAWERTPFREVSYAEDRLLAIDMLRVGYAKAFVPSATVVHSHDYTASQYLRRCFDEWRALCEIYGWREPADPLRLARNLRGELSGGWRSPIVKDMGRSKRLIALIAVARKYFLRTAGALLGSRAERLPVRMTGYLSLEGRAGFCPLAFKALDEAADNSRR